MIAIAVDTSAVMAVALSEPERPMFEAILFSPDTSLVVSTATRVELQVAVRSRRGEAGPVEVGRLLEGCSVDFVPLDES